MMISLLIFCTGLWFQEKSEQWPGMAQTLKVEKILWTEKSLYQDVLVFQSTNHGTILVLDGAIQCSTKDEFSYGRISSITAPHAPLTPCRSRRSRSYANGLLVIKK